MKKVLRYLSATQTIGIHLSRVNDYSKIGYCNADWGGDMINRKNQTGFLVYVGGTLIAWSSKKKAMVAQSSMESEYRANASTTQESKAVKALLSELGITAPFLMCILSDNRSATFVAQNPMCHTKLRVFDMCP